MFDATPVVCHFFEVARGCCMLRHSWGWVGKTIRRDVVSCCWRFFPEPRRFCREPLLVKVLVEKKVERTLWVCLRNKIQTWFGTEGPCAHAMILRFYLKTSAVIYKHNMCDFWRWPLSRKLEASTMITRRRSTCQRERARVKPWKVRRHLPPKK